MKLIQEANLDDQLNRQMMKIQDAIEAIEKMVPNMEYPVASQQNMVEQASSDLMKIAKALKEKRAALPGAKK
jgi:uncharacterized coiled-coil DUF342 family protein